MTKLLSNRKTSDALAALAIAAAIASLLFFPTEAVEAAKNGLTLCCNIIIPSLFPFFALSSLIVELGLVRYLDKALEKVMRPLFNLSGACSVAFALGFIGGYPVGAKTAIALYEKGYCTKSEAEHLLSFCNNSGPAFILGVVGAGIFSSSAIGLLLYLAHIAASIVVGILFRFYKPADRSSKTVIYPKAEPTQFAKAFTEAVKSSFYSTLNICAFVIFFTVVIKMLFSTGIISLLSTLLASVFSAFGLTAKWAERLIVGFIELTSGVWTLNDAADALTSRLSMAAFMLGWAGLSIHCQALSFMGNTRISSRTYFGGKILHGVISATFVYFLSKVLPLEVPVAHYLAEQVTGIANLDFSTALTISSVAAILVGLLLLLFSFEYEGKNSGKRKKKLL